MVLVGIRSFPFGARPIFREGKSLVAGHQLMERPTPRQAANAGGNVWTAFNAWRGWLWRGHWRNPSWMGPWCKAHCLGGEGCFVVHGWVFVVVVVVVAVAVVVVVVVVVVAVVVVVVVVVSICFFFPLFFFWILASSSEKDETHWRSIFSIAWKWSSVANVGGRSIVGSKAETDIFLLQTSWKLWAPPLCTSSKNNTPNLLATATHRSPLKKWCKRFMTPGALEGMEHEKQHQARHGGDQREARRHPGTFQIRTFFRTGCNRGH